jgi:hypothetical protein
MRRTTLVLCALLVTAFGCNRVKPELDALKHRWAGVSGSVSGLLGRLTHKAPPPPPVIVHHVVPKPPVPAPPPREVAAVSTPGQVHIAHDVPYVSQDTGTLTTGMSERDVYALWGPPVAVRRLGEYTYLFFRNGCEHRCGTEDVVTLDNGQVVNAVVRWPGHNFLGAPSGAPSAPPVPSSATDSVPVKAAVPAAPPPDTTKPDSTHSPSGPTAP